jgi:hypothetical protein
MPTYRATVEVKFVIEAEDADHAKISAYGFMRQRLPRSGRAAYYEGSLIEVESIGGIDERRSQKRGG